LADQDLGTKRVCADCGAKFYDLNKNPMICPKCGHEEAVTVAKAKRKPAEAPAPAPKPEPAKAEAETDDENDIVASEDDSLEDLAAKELASDGDDVDEELLPGDDEEDDPFLTDDDDDDDDDVSALIPGVSGDDD
jgi:uncharacterized protein (TIGR02300 family)